MKSRFQMFALINSQLLQWQEQKASKKILNSTDRSRPVRTIQKILCKMLQHPHFFFRQWPKKSAGEIFFREAGVIRAVEFCDFISEVFEDAADDPVFSGM
jgi:hypothetical protein